MKLENKVAIVTGSSRGIGKAIALLFVREGARVVINCDKDIAHGQEVSDSIGSEKSLFIKADISKEDDVKRLVAATLERFGRIDILINNAGEITRPADWKCDVDTWHKTIDVNLTGAWLMIREVAPLMQKQNGGNIVNVTSVVGMFGSPFVLAYSCAKGGLISMTKSFAKACAPNIRVNAIAPSIVDTEMTAGAGQEVIDRFIQQSVLKRISTPEELAKAVLFLASDDSSYITGQVLVVDGGYSLK